LCLSWSSTYLVQASEEDIVDSSARRRSAGDVMMGMQLCEAVAECDVMEGSSSFCMSLIARVPSLEGQMSSVYRKKDLREIILVLTTSFLFGPFDHFSSRPTYLSSGQVTALPKRLPSAHGSAVVSIVSVCALTSTGRSVHYFLPGI
jgi:hypothetical protein